MDTSVYNHLLGTFNPKYTTKYVNDPKAASFCCQEDPPDYTDFSCISARLFK